MDTNNSLNTEKIIDDSDLSLNLDLNQIKKFFLRNRKLIISAIFFAMVPSIGYSLIRKPTYEGIFQIVLSDNSSQTKLTNAKSLLEKYDGMSDFLNIGGGSSKKLETEVKILESPLILMPSYEYVRNVLKEKNTNVQKFSFDKWKKKLNVLLIKRTSVLEISYRDKNRDLIIPVLNLISKDYQKYSGRDRLKSIDNGIKYLEDQIKTIKEQSREAYKNAFIFAAKNNLNTKIINSEPNTLISKSLNKGKNKVNEMPDKYQAAIELKFINKQLKNLENIDNENVPQILYNNQNKDNKLYLELAELDQKLLNANSIFLDSDRVVQNLSKERNFLVKTINENTKNQLESEKFRLEVFLESLDRPNEILIKDMELKKEANRLSNIYDQMTSNLRLSKLEKAKKIEPWELISNPTLREEPVGIKNAYIPIFGFILGSFSGILLANLKERKKDLIFELRTFTELIGYKKLCELSIQKRNLWKDYIELICEKQNLLKDAKDLNLIFLGNSQTYKNEIKNLFANSYKNLSVDNKLNKNKSHILIAESGMIKKFELFTFQEQSNLIKPEIVGFIFIN